MDNEKHKLTKINSGTNSDKWLLLLMGKAILKQQFRNNTYSPTLEQKREALEDWSRLADRMGQYRFTHGLNEAFLHTTFIPSCADIEQWAPGESIETGMYKPFPKIEPPKDPVTQEQLDKFNALVHDIAEGKVIVKVKAAEDTQERVSRGMRAEVTDPKRPESTKPDGKGAAANDK